jgi:adenosylhomocysteine nucleosidase
MGAVSEEIAGIKRDMNISDRIRLGKSEAWPGKWKNKNILLVRTGVGKQRAEETTRQVIEKFHPEVIISMGYAGALIDGLKVGDLFIADCVLSEEGETLEIDCPPNSEWLDLAKNTPPLEQTKIKFGRLITVNSVIHSPEAKKCLASQFSAQVVEMETLVIARLTKENQIPFISVRGISDEVNHELIDSSSFLGDDGEISKIKAGWYVLTHPKSFKSALSLRSQTQVATRNLTAFLSDLISK